MKQLERLKDGGDTVLCQWSVGKVFLQDILDERRREEAKDLGDQLITPIFEYECDSLHQMGLSARGAPMTNRTLISVRLPVPPHSLQPARFSHSYLEFRQWRPSPNDPRGGREASRR